MTAAPQRTAIKVFFSFLFLPLPKVLQTEASLWMHAENFVIVHRRKAENRNAWKMWVAVASSPREKRKYKIGLPSECCCPAHWRSCFLFAISWVVHFVSWQLDTVENVVSRIRITRTNRTHFNILEPTWRNANESILKPVVPTCKH